MEALREFERHAEAAYAALNGGGPAPAAAAAAAAGGGGGEEQGEQSGNGTGAPKSPQRVIYQNS